MTTSAEAGPAMGSPLQSPPAKPEPPVPFEPPLSGPPAELVPPAPPPPLSPVVPAAPPPRELSAVLLQATPIETMIEKLSALFMTSGQQGAGRCRFGRENHSVLGRSGTGVP